MTNFPVMAKDIGPMVSMLVSKDGDVINAQNIIMDGGMWLGVLT